MRVLVTGGSRGSGSASPRVSCAPVRRSRSAAAAPSRWRTRLQSLGDHGDRIHTVVADVASPESCAQMAAEAQERLGGLDVVCANAGIYPERTLDELDAADVAEIMGTNVGGTIFTVQACRAALKASGRGRVVVTSSITGPVTGYPGLSHYGASKAAQLGFVRSAALELAVDDITINAILPGSILTDGLAGLGEEAIARMSACIPQRRLGSPADIAAAAVFFASEGAGFITGQTLVVDGGQTLPELPLGS